MLIIILVFASRSWENLRFATVILPAVAVDIAEKRPCCDRYHDDDYGGGSSSGDGEKDDRPTDRPKMDATT